jgi:molybdenum cofactor synthesis domain-containing protein
MSQAIEVVSVNISREKGTSKYPVESVVVCERGIMGDAHAGTWHRQVSLLAQESIERFSAKTDRTYEFGEFAENLTTRGLDLGRVAILDHLRIGAVELEVTQIGKACHGDGCAIYREVGKCVMPKEGIFCRVLQGGTIVPGEKIEYEPQVLKILVITMSDRASSGEYEDRSGPRAQELIEGFLCERRWRPEVERSVLPDEAERLRECLTNACEAGVDVAFTVGGTGVGPRDMTPDVVTSLGGKVIPGIMDAIRLKYGSKNPTALLSRGVATVSGSTVIFTLPGSVRAVEEYLGEILPLLPHLLLMVRGLGH